MLIYCWWRTEVSLVAQSRVVELWSFVPVDSEMVWGCEGAAGDGTASVGFVKIQLKINTKSDHVDHSAMQPISAAGCRLI
jgi:hypothetical protein